jgi:hypothetical protein
MYGSCVRLVSGSTRIRLMKLSLSREPARVWVPGPLRARRTCPSLTAVRTSPALRWPGPTPVLLLPAMRSPVQIAFHEVVDALVNRGTIDTRLAMQSMLTEVSATATEYMSRATAPSPKPILTRSASSAPAMPTLRSLYTREPATGTTGRTIPAVRRWTSSGGLYGPAPVVTRLALQINRVCRPGTKQGNAHRVPAA